MRKPFQTINIIRISKRITGFLGPLNYVSQDRIQIDITCRCSLRCPNCNRSCSQAPSDESMSIEQIERFLRESIEHKIKWKTILLGGGEPTLHPDLRDMVRLLLDYKNNYSRKTHISIATNNYTDITKQALSLLPKEVAFNVSNKTSEPPIFAKFNIAPVDSLLYRYADFSNGCNALSCGIGLTPYGYYCCGLAGNIDRVFGYDIGRKKLPSAEDAMRDQMQVFCRLCGFFRWSRILTTKQATSPTWEEAYIRYKKSRPVLSLY